MTAPRPRYTPTPRVLSEAATAMLLGKGADWFRAHRSQLEAEGFPKLDALLGGTDSAAVHRWLDQRSRLATVDPDREIEAWQP